MSVLDEDDEKPYLYTRQLLRREYIRLSGEYFGQCVLEKQIKDEPVLQMMNKMFSGPVSSLPDNLQELYKVLKMLEDE